MELSYKDRVSNGIMYLDIEVVGWRDKINLDQVYGGFSIGLSMFVNQRKGMLVSAYGFDISNSDDDCGFSELTKEWKRQLGGTSGPSKKEVYTSPAHSEVLC